MIAIYEDQGGDLDPDDYEPVALYDDGEWVEGGDAWEPYYPEGTSEDVLAAQLDGPSTVAVEVSEGSAIGKDRLGPPQSTLMGVGQEVEIVGDQNTEGDEDDEDEEREKAEGRVAVDSVHDAPQDAVVHAELDDEGDVEGLYYEP